MKLLDKRATELAASSLFLTRAEFMELYPHNLGGRINYVFKHDRPMEVADGEAKLLMKKYPHVMVWEKVLATPDSNRHQELAKMKYNELKKYAGTLKMPFEDTRVKTDILIDNIVAKEIEIHTAEEKAKANRRDGVTEGNKETK